ncbi:hypothetical protein ACFO1B_42210 [Dactylosporangium siamense]|uniref:DUF11 domain-containing protein n=1 Tax=Dactylosporangium siamense TaxID=685454 RepID=A0A919PVK5_9ACTN|nr:hypothetical protein [Dactylosporangium siamense]GIG51037.1 hypothetical protein Dsi01nite_090780 [Dactylosporangium siamense]
MSPGRWVRLLLTAGITLAGSALAAAPAAAAPAPPCPGGLCVRYWADLTITAWASPSTPVQPGTIHYYTVAVTNTGWRTSPTTVPNPAPGPAADSVYVAFLPTSPVERPPLRGEGGVGPGPPWKCVGYLSNGIVCDTNGIPTNSTRLVSFPFLAPFEPGTYTTNFSVYAFNFTEYNVNNNTYSLTYQVGPPA